MGVYGAGGGNIAALGMDKLEKGVIGSSSPILPLPSGRTQRGTALQPSGSLGAAVLGVSDSRMVDSLTLATGGLPRNMFYGAKLEIIGDPTIDTFQCIQIDVIVERGDGVVKKKEHRKHYTSGVYAVKGVTDSISGGSYTTTIDLIQGSLRTGFS
jgi:hypothetical protein